MIEYLKKYKQLLEQLESNNNKIQENELLLNESKRKWNDTKDREEKLDLEINELNKEYSHLLDEKEKNFFKKVEFTLTMLSIIILILTIFHSIVNFLLAAPLLVASSGIIYLTIFIISKCTSIFEKQFKKDKDILELLETINEKENELSNVKTICGEYSQEIIKYHSESKKLNEKNIWINNSINELMIDYATPIFDEQLKNIQEEPKDKSLTKTKNPKI